MLQCNINIVQCTKCQSNSHSDASLNSEAPLKPSALEPDPSLKAVARSAFPLAGDARFLEIQLTFHAAARLVGDPPFLQKTEDVFALGLDELGAKAGTEGGHSGPTASPDG